LTIIEKFEGVPARLNTVAASLGEESDTIAEVYEPYLLRMGFLEEYLRGE
jgi:Holliday junction DNA helicase RuvB